MSTTSCFGTTSSLLSRATDLVLKSQSRGQARTLLSVASGDDRETEQINEVREVLRSLALGKHPDTGEFLPHSEVLNDPKTMRALFLAVEALRDLAFPPDKRRVRPACAGQPLTPDEDKKLTEEFAQRLSLDSIAATHQRYDSSIPARLVHLKLVKSRKDARRILARKE